MKFFSFLKKLKYIEIKLKPTQIGGYDADITPKIFVTDGKYELRITEFIRFSTTRNNFTPTIDDVPVGFKRFDDWVDNKGGLMSKSTTFRRQIEYIKCDKNWLKWAWYKICRLIKR